MSKTITIKPISNTTGTVSNGTISNSDYAYDNNNTTCATFTANYVSKKSAYAYTYYNFSLDDIPQDAEVISISLNGLAKALNTSGSSGYFYIGIYDGTTVISSSKVSITSSTATSFASEFTEAQINNFMSSNSPRIRARASRTNTYNSTVTGYLYNLYLNITYKLNGVKTTVKINGDWKEATSMVKVNGEWIAANEGYIKVNNSWEKIY